MYKLDLERAEEPEVKFCFIDYVKAFDGVDHN